MERHDYVPMQKAAVATGNGTSVNVTGTNIGPHTVLSMQVTGITTATVTFEGTIDNTNWVSLVAQNVATAATATTAAALN